MSDTTQEAPVLEDGEVLLFIEMDLRGGNFFARIAERVSGSSTDRSADTLGDLMDGCFSWAGVRVRSFEGVTTLGEVIARIKQWNNPELTVEISQRIL